MMSLFRDLTYLEHIKGSIGKIQSYTEGLSEEGFQRSTLVQDAVVRQFEIIGEATKRLSDDLKQQYPEVPWKDMAGMRDVLIHDYINVEIDIVWKTVTDYVQPLLEQINRIIKEINAAT
jgi:uncharacterized protein with HEPN domain